MASKTFYECGCMVQGDQEFLCAKHKAGASQAASCQHQLKRERDRCTHGYALGTTCESCIIGCPQCWDECASASSYSPRPVERNISQAGAAAPDVERLIERLRKRAEQLDGDALSVDFREAADALSAAHAEIARLIEPLKRSDDPEESEAIRSTPEYVLMTREAADMEAELHHKWRYERDAAEAREAALRRELEEAQAKQRIDEAGYENMRDSAARLAEREAALRAENERISKAHDEALIELEKAGWPCRLAELPALFRETEAHVARLEAENERLKASISEQVKAAYDMGMASNRERAEQAEAAFKEMHDAACEESAKAEAAEAALKEQQVAHRKGET